MPFDGQPGVASVAAAARSERLLELARVVEQVEETKFDLCDWSRNGRCDSVACAVGWAMRDDWFQRHGFVWRGRGPYYEGRANWQAVRAFFGLTREEAFDLFHVGRYDRATRAAVGARIRKLAGAR